jgi:hypothetical protein
MPEDAAADSALPNVDLPLAQWVRVSMMLTAAGVLAAGIAVPIIGRRGRGTIDLLDIALGAAMVLGGAWALAALQRNRDERALTGAVALSVPLVAIGLGAWMPTFMPVNAGTVAAEVRRDFGGAPVAFYQGVDNAAMVFEMRQVMPQYHSPADLPSATNRPPGLVLISWGADESTAPPPGYVAHATRKVEDRSVQIYRPIAASAGTGPGAQHEPDERAGQ